MKVARETKVTQNFKDNTVEMVIDGKKCRVNKFLAPGLKEKLGKMSKSKKA
tara:strand:- start:1834 stop:1986 length:153 start_codon:yes stop_codon:yes gene_type:complete